MTLIKLHLTTYFKLPQSSKIYQNVFAYLKSCMICFTPHCSYTQVYTVRSCHVKQIIHVRMELSVWKKPTWIASLWGSTATASKASLAPTASWTLTSATLTPASTASAMMVHPICSPVTPVLEKSEYFILFIWNTGCPRICSLLQMSIKIPKISKL